jgi:hypothetical protein
VLLLGVGMAVSVAPLATTVMGAVDTHHTGLASGINNAVSRTAALLSIAVVSIFVVAAFNSNLDSRLATLQLPPAVHHLLDAQRIKLAGVVVPSGVNAAMRASLQHTIAESFVTSFRLAMFIAVGLALAGTLSAAFMIESKEARSTAETLHTSIGGAAEQQPQTAH